MADPADAAAGSAGALVPAAGPAAGGLTTAAAGLAEASARSLFSCVAGGQMGQCAFRLAFAGCLPFATRSGELVRAPFGESFGPFGPFGESFGPFGESFGPFGEPLREAPFFLLPATRAGFG